MAGTLMDAIKSNMGQAAAGNALPGQQASQAPVTDQTQAAQGLLRAKTGKQVAGAGSEGVTSNIGEQQAAQQTKMGMQQLGQQAQLGQQQLAGQNAAQQQQQQQGMQQVQQAGQFNTIQTKLAVTNQLNQLQQQKGQLDTQQYAAQLEQVGTALRLQNQQYVDQLQNEGTKARLDDQNQFNLQLQQSVFGDNTALLKQQLGNQDVLNVNDQQFKQAMQKIDLSTSIEMLQNQAQTAKQQAIWTGVGGIVAAGVGAGAAAASGGGAGAAGSNAAESTNVSVPQNNLANGEMEA